MNEDIGRVASPNRLSSSTEPQEGLRPMGFDPAREQLDAWLEAHCGRGLPYADATDLPSALHGLAYLLRQIEGTNSYKVFVGQCGPATSALRWALDHFAREALASDSGRLPEGEDAERSGAAECEASQSGAEGNRPDPASLPSVEIRREALEEALKDLARHSYQHGFLDATHHDGPPTDNEEAATLKRIDSVAVHESFESLRDRFFPRRRSDIMSRRCLICANLNPCRDHSGQAQESELERNCREIRRIERERALSPSKEEGRL